jgi:hypothetical protein
MRLNTASPSIKMWYSLTLEMVGETSSGSCLAPAMFLGQSEATNQLELPPTCGAVLLSVPGPPPQSLGAES